MAEKVKNLGHILETDIYRCVYYGASVDRPLDLETYFRYVTYGCYICSGYNFDCEHYLSKRALYNFGLNGVNNDFDKLD